MPELKVKTITARLIWYAINKSKSISQENSRMRIIYRKPVFLSGNKVKFVSAIHVMSFFRPHGKLAANN